MRLKCPVPSSRPVALLAEGVGRNCPWCCRPLTDAAVALLAEGVGRNGYGAAQRAIDRAVALLAEGVGRNAADTSTLGALSLSPSSRRAWVEISKADECRARLEVALLAEGVGRNLSALYSSESLICRPPRGGRG